MTIECHRCSPSLGRAGFHPPSTACLSLTHRCSTTNLTSASAWAPPHRRPPPASLRMPPPPAACHYMPPLSMHRQPTQPPALRPGCRRCSHTSSHCCRQAVSPTTTAPPPKPSPWVERACGSREPRIDSLHVVGSSRIFLPSTSSDGTRRSRPTVVAASSRPPSPRTPSHHHRDHRGSITPPSARPGSPHRRHPIATPAAVAILPDPGSDLAVSSAATSTSKRRRHHHQTSPPPHRSASPPADPPLDLAGRFPCPEQPPNRPPG